MKARAPSPPNSSSSECIGQPYTTYAMVPPAANGACEQPLLWTTTVYWGFNIWVCYLRIHFNLPWNSGWGGWLKVTTHTTWWEWKEGVPIVSSIVIRLKECSLHFSFCTHSTAANPAVGWKNAVHMIQRNVMHVLDVLWWQKSAQLCWCRIAFTCTVLMHKSSLRRAAADEVVLRIAAEKKE